MTQSVGSTSQEAGVAWIERCPICDGPAQALLAPLGEWRRVICPSCGHFKLSATAEVHLLGATHESKRAALEDAQRQARPGHLAYIKEKPASVEPAG